MHVHYQKLQKKVQGRKKYCNPATKTHVNCFNIFAVFLPLHMLPFFFLTQKVQTMHTVFAIFFVYQEYLIFKLLKAVTKIICKVHTVSHCNR